VFSGIFLAGPAFGELPRREPWTKERLSAAVAASDIPTDDWPYLYLAPHGDTISLSLMAILLAIATAVFAVSPAMRRSLDTRGFDGPMFLFGAAFLILRRSWSRNEIWCGERRG
jgi:hypothetical protein